jgi:hypothetical protein
MADAVGLSRVSSSERRLKAISAHICQTNNSHASSSVKKSEQEIKQDKFPPPDTPHHVTFPLKNKMGKPRVRTSSMLPHTRVHATNMPGNHTDDNPDPPRPIRRK